MKKKIALLLAAAMTVATMPTNTFAATTNWLSTAAQYAPTETLFIEEGLFGTPQYDVTITNDTIDDDIDNIFDGSSLVIQLKNHVTTGQSFTVTLENADWYYQRADAGYEMRYNDVHVANQATGKDNEYQIFNANLGYYYPGLTSTSKGVYNRYGFDNAYAYYAGLTSSDSDFANKPQYSSNYNSYGHGIGGTNKLYNNRYVEIPYTMEFLKSDSKSAQITIDASSEWIANLAGISASDALDKCVLVVPIIARTTGEESEASRIKVSTYYSVPVFTSNNAFVQSASSATKTTIKSPATAHEIFPVERLTIQEVRTNSLKSAGTFNLKTPSGFEFGMLVHDNGNEKDSTRFKVAYANDSNGTISEKSFQDALSLTTEGGLGGTIVIEDMYYKALTRNGQYVDYDPSVIYIKYSGLNPSTQTPGAMLLETTKNYSKSDPLKVIALENAPSGEFKISIADKDHNGNNKSGVTAEDIKAGIRADWNILLTAGTPTDLYRGRYEDQAREDSRHKAAKVTFKETLPGAWLSNRQTVFTLPDGVKIGKLKISDTDNIINGSTFEGTYELDTTNTSSLKRGYVTLEQDRFTLSGITTESDENAEFVIELWLSLEPGHEYDEIELTVEGTAISDELPSVVIANALDPVTVDVSRVTDIKIGYQYQDVADFSITETKAGILERAKTVKVSLTDGISSDMSFVSAAEGDIEVTDGDLKIKNLRLIRSSDSFYGSSILDSNSTGTMAFDIANASTKASTVTFTNVQVKIDRTVPETNLRPYQVVVWGDAIANNYDSRPNSNSSTTTTGYEPATFDTPGYMEDYIRVATYATDITGLNSVVKVTIGDPVITIGGQKATMDTAAFIDPASNSTMVPVRFVSVALGIGEDQVKWDDAAKTVTIYNGARIIQFAIGSDQIMVNGASTTMYSPDGLPVKALIKDERSFIPFRALGTALGVPVSWDAETQTAIYNSQS